ncbi:MAG: DUF3418 domain-containing protein, partial [Thiotrichaceae bacterium]
KKSFKALTDLTDQKIEKENITTWDFGDLPESTVINTNGISIRAYPALVDKKTSVAIKLFDTPEKASLNHSKGLLRLFILVDSKQYNSQKRQLKNIQSLCLRYTSSGTCEELKHGILQAAFRNTYLQDVTIRTQQQFSDTLQTQQAGIAVNCDELCHLLDPILTLHHQVHKELKGNIKINWLEALADIKDQVQHIIYSGFLSETSTAELRQIPRFLKGIIRRLDKLAASEQRDRELRLEVQQLWDRYKDTLKKKPELKDQLREYRWQIEEFRISLFAQDLGTNNPVSAKRLNKLWHDLGL